MSDKPTCANCQHFRRRPDDMPWPRAGVSRDAEGQCSIKRIGTDVKDWRAGTDWCDQHAKVKP